MYYALTDDDVRSLLDLLPRRHQADVGLRYDTTLGSARDDGFRGQYEPMYPFDDEFAVFPLTLMELTLPDVESDPERAWQVCERLLEEARENEAVMTVLRHPRYFSNRDHRTFGTLYRRLIERAPEMGAWVGPPGELYTSLDHYGTSDSPDLTAPSDQRPEQVQQ